MERYMFGTMVLHVAVDLLLMMGVNQLCGYDNRWWRMLTASLVGCLHAGACMRPGFYFLGNDVWRTVALALTALVAFGADTGALRRGIVFGIMRLAVLGALRGTDESFWTCVFVAAMICLLSLVGFWDGTGKQYLPVRICYGGKTVNFTALLDTGNLLSDPVTGSSVLVVSSQVAQSLLDLEPEQIANPVDTMQHSCLPGLRLLPYQTVGHSGGLLLGMRFQNVKIGEHIGPQTVAFSPSVIGKGNTFQALAGGIA